MFWVVFVGVGGMVLFFTPSGNWIGVVAFVVPRLLVSLSLALFVATVVLYVGARWQKILQDERIRSWLWGMGGMCVLLFFFVSQLWDPFVRTLKMMLAFFS